MGGQDRDFNGADIQSQQIIPNEFNVHNNLFNMIHELEENEDLENVQLDDEIEANLRKKD